MMLICAHDIYNDAPWGTKQNIFKTEYQSK